MHRMRIGDGASRLELSKYKKLESGKFYVLNRIAGEFIFSKYKYKNKLA
jgi:hypothetical protein